MIRRRTAVVLLLVTLSVVARSSTHNDFVGASQGAPDFSLGSNVGSRTILRGSSTTYTVTVNALNGFAGSIDLAVSGLPPRASASFDPAILSSAGSSTLTVITGSKTPAGTWTLTITALSGALTRTATVTLIVTSLPDFTISVTPGSTTIVPGGSSNYTVTVGAQGGFSGTVNLTATGVPPGASASFSPPSILGAGSATLTVTTTANVETGMSLLTISGASGPLNHSTAANLVISESNASRVIGIDFVGTGRPIGLWGIAGVVPKPNWNSAAGASRTTPLPLMDETGAASGASVIWTSYSTGRLPIKGNTANRRMMREYLDTSDAGAPTTVTVAGLPNGAYDVYVYADGGNANTAKTAAYSISGAGVAATTINLTDAAHTNFNATFTQAIDSNGNYVKFSVVATGFTLTATPVATSGNSQAPVSAMQIVPTGSPPSDTSPPTVSITGPTDGSTVVNTITVSATASDNVSVSGVQFLLDGAPLGAEDTIAPYSITWTTTSTSNGAHALSARARDAAGNVAVATSVGVTVANDLTPPQFLQITAQSITTSSVAISWETNEPSNSQVEYGLTASYGNATVLDGGLVTSHAQSLSNLTASTLYHYRVRSTDPAGNLAVSTDQTFTTTAPAPDFSFTVTPSTRIIPPTGTTSYDVDVAYLNGFTSSSVDLWVTDLPAGATGAFAFDPMPHQGRTTLTVNSKSVTPGTYLLTAGATAEGIVRSQNVTLVVSTTADFSLTASPSVQNVPRGNATSYQISLGATNGFSDAVSLSVSGLPAQTTASFSQNPIVPPGASTLTVDTGTTTPAGQYTLVVTGEAGGLTRTVTLTLIVSSLTATWSVETIGATGVPNNSVRVGPVRSDGLNRVYIGTIATGRMLEYSWNGVSWSGAVDVGGSLSGSEIHNFNIGSARLDPRQRIYAASTDRNVYEIWHDAAGWQQLTVGTLDDQAMHTAVGDGRGDGIARLYAVSIQSAYEFTWTGSSWSGQRIASVPGAHGIAVAPGRGAGIMSLFVASISSGTFELRYNGASWVRTGMGDSGDVRDVDWGVGRNDGVARIYSALLDGRIRELAWNGNGWTITDLPDVGAPLIHAYVLAGRNDGINRVYSSSANGKVYEFSWSGSSWSAFNMGGGPEYMYGLHFGPGRNDGAMRLYGADRGSVNSVYEYTWTAPGPIDGTPPDPPSGFTAVGGVGQVGLTWNPAFDNVGVAGYNVHRSSVPGLTADSTNRIGQTTATSFADSGLPSGNYYYRVVAFDAGGNLSAPSSEASAAATSDSQAPTVALTSPQVTRPSPGLSLFPRRPPTTSPSPADSSWWMAWRSAPRTQRLHIRSVGILRARRAESTN